MSWMRVITLNHIAQRCVNTSRVDECWNYDHCKYWKTYSETVYAHRFIVKWICSQVSDQNQYLPEGYKVLVWKINTLKSAYKNEMPSRCFMLNVLLLDCCFLKITVLLCCELLCQNICYLVHWQYKCALFDSAESSGSGSKVIIGIFIPLCIWPPLVHKNYWIIYFSQLYPS